jgi:photosystem II stability/assembly factor-like uncharacterized protein
MGLTRCFVLLGCVIASPVAAQKWTFIGPAGGSVPNSQTNGAGRVSALAVYPGSKLHALAGPAGGGLYETKDAGKTWTPMTFPTAPPPFSAVSALSFGSDANTLYICTGTSGIAGYDSISGVGLVITQDGGHSWTTNSTFVHGCIGVSANPGTPGEVVVTSLDGTYLLNGYGANIVAQYPKLRLSSLQRSAAPAHSNLLYGIGFDPNNPQSSSQLWRSKDGGKTWGIDNNNGLGLYPVAAFCLDPAKPMRLLVTMQNDDAAGNHILTLVSSPDGGDSFPTVLGTSSLGQGRLNDFSGGVLIVSPTHPNTVLIGNFGYLRADDVTKPNPWKSNNVLGLVHADTRAFAWAGDNLLLATDGGVWWTDGLLGKKAGAWRNKNLNTLQLYRIATDPNNAQRVYGTAQDNGVWRRPDTGGTTWIPYDGPGDGSMGLFAPPEKPDSVFFSAIAGSWAALGRALDADASQPKLDVITPPNVDFNTNSIAVGIPGSATQNSTLIYGDGWLIQSTHYGSTGKWTPLKSTVFDGNTDVTSVATAACLNFAQTAAATCDPNTTLPYRVTSIAATGNAGDPILVAKAIYAGGWLNVHVYYSSDGGKTFHTATNVPQTLVPSLAVSGSNAYLAAMDPSGPPIYCSTDGGASWSPCSKGLKNGRYGRVVRIDPLHPSRVYAGTDLGAFTSTLGGEWTPLGSGLPICPVNDIEIAPGGSVLRAGTHGCGAWELCGASNGEQCCNTDPPSCTAGLVCSPANNRCMETCGEKGQPCCTGKICGARLTCSDGKCVCGGLDQYCCNDGNCGFGLACVNAFCRNSGGDCASCKVKLDTCTARCPPGDSTSTCTCPCLSDYCSCLGERKCGPCQFPLNCLAR